MNINNYFKYFDKLNYDLQNEILSKIRKSQNKDLLEDIINFKKAKKKIFEKYENNDSNYDINSESFIYFQIESDLIKYFNDDITTLYGITETNIEKLERILSIKLKMKKNKALIATKMMIDNKISVNKRINMLIGALTIKERQNFIDKLNTHYFI
jgi:hypothetical protein|uniref:Uncharacterized protein n=1 Tax=viral metagenome TaxID=1070528 RepID=A0A6C0JNN6_9ZZZZ